MRNEATGFTRDSQFRKSLSRILMSILSNNLSSTDINELRAQIERSTTQLSIHEALFNNEAEHRQLLIHDLVRCFRRLYDEGEMEAVHAFFHGDQYQRLMQEHVNAPPDVFARRLRVGQALCHVLQELRREYAAASAPVASTSSAGVPAPSPIPTAVPTAPALVVSVPPVVLSTPPIATLPAVVPEPAAAEPMVVDPVVELAPPSSAPASTRESSTSAAVLADDEEDEFLGFGDLDPAVPQESDDEESGEGSEEDDEEDDSSDDNAMDEDVLVATALPLSSSAKGKQRAE